MKQDADSGLWVPDGTPEPKYAPFPPRLTMPSDTRHVRAIEGISRDLAMNSNSVWRDTHGFPLPSPRS